MYLVLVFEKNTEKNKFDYFFRLIINNIINFIKKNSNKQQTNKQSNKQNSNKQQTKNGNYTFTNKKSRFL